MHLGDFASWAAIIGTGVGATGLLVTVRQAVSGRQRELRGQLRKVLRTVSVACDDYAYADRRNAASGVLGEAVGKLKVIHDEGILSPSPRQIHDLLMHVYGLATQAEASARFVSLVGSMVPADERAHLKANQEHNTEMLLRYVARLSAKYRHVTRKMDNGHVETYLHYRLLPPLIVRR